MNEPNSVEPDDLETIVVRARADQGAAADDAAGSVVLESDTTVVRAPRSSTVAATDLDATIAQSQSQSQSQSQLRPQPRPAPTLAPAQTQQLTAPVQASAVVASLPRVYGPRAEYEYGAESAGGSRSGSQPGQEAQLDRSDDQEQPLGEAREQLPSFARRTRRARAATLAGYVVVVCVSVAGLWTVGVLAFAG